MSAFLGPIHYWLYGKIKLQEDLVDQCVIVCEKNGLADMKQQLISKYGEFSKRPLEEIIEGDNIHGWLQDKVSRAEYKLAESVTKLLQKDASLLSELEAVFMADGEIRGQALLQEEDLNLGLVYKAISDSLLDGMPCDHAVALIKQEADEVAWKTVQCVHTPYWAEVGGDIENYYRLREAWLSGFAKALGLQFERLGNRSYAIKKA